MPLIVFGGVCLALSAWVAFTNSRLLVGHYELWPYLATIGAIGLVGGIASSFARWEDEEEGTGVSPGPDELVVSRSEWESLQRAASRPMARRPQEEPARAAPQAAHLATAEVTERPVVVSQLPNQAPAIATLSSTTPVRPVPSDEDRPSPSPKTQSPAPLPVPAALAVESQPKVAAGPPPVAAAPPPQVRPEVRRALASLLANLAAKAQEGEEGVAEAPSGLLTPRVTEVKGEARDRAAESGTAGGASTGPAAAAPAGAAAPTATHAASPSTRDTDIQREFDQLLEALAAEPAPIARALPQCIACDRPVQLPYVSCQACANPLCPDCTAKADQEGHPRKCPTCALLQKYS